MQRSDEGKEGGQKGGALKERLRGVRRRKRTRGPGAQAISPADPFACAVLASKMKLVEARRRQDDGRRPIIGSERR